MKTDREKVLNNTIRSRARRVALQTSAACVASSLVLVLVFALLERSGAAGGAIVLIFALILAGAGASVYILLRKRLKALQEAAAADGRGNGYDITTGLPDREHFNALFAEALKGARDGGHELEVLYLDLDRFRNIVRALGHGAGQAILRQVGERLKSVLGEGETLANIGGDQFILLAADRGSTEYAQGLASRLLSALQKPFYYREHPLHLTASIGIALCPHDGRSAEVLVKNAYAAANRAKEMGGNHYQFYFSDLSEYKASTLLLENRLHKALEGEEFVLLYQPQANLTAGQIEGMEVLVSWNHPDHPGLTPSEFIPLAEESGLIEAIGEWILRRACEQNRRWQESGLPPMKMAVNVSARQFRRGNLVDLVGRILAETRLDPRWLTLEITETVLMQDIEETINTLYGLRRLGVQVAVDDFGIGYSSLNYLKKFPIHTLKLDRAFVDNIPEDGDATAIVAAVIALGHAMNLEIVGEGVERREQWNFLKAKGCDKVQGFLVAHPLKADDFASFIGEHADRAVAGPCAS